MKKIVPTQAVGVYIDELLTVFDSKRKPFERRWYDNNFFDDGHHFRYVSRATGKIVDQSEMGAGSSPKRAIPKASRQIRGIANLLTNPTYTPSVYPARVEKHMFGSEDEYMQQKALVADQAKKSGLYLESVWDELDLVTKMVQMIILTCKHGVSFLQVYPDSIKESINAEVYDAFDVYLSGSVSDLQQSPAIIKTLPRSIEEIKADEMFDEENLQGLNPDNKYANSEIKEAYMKSRFGMSSNNDTTATIMQKEAFIKEYICDENIDMIREYSPNVLEGKKMGDPIIRHVFTAGGITLKDEYLAMSNYPFVDLRFEPGTMYQVPLIERFIPANKSLDIISNRVERYLNSMVSGIYLKKKGENFKISNSTGAQVIEYSSTPPIQMNIAPLPAFVMNYMSFINAVIEEQGASTSALGQLPEGVKSGVAIESMKATEYANLDIPSKMVKKAVKEISELILEITATFIEPKQVFQNSKDGGGYFDVIGENGLKAREMLGMRVDDEMTPINKGSKVRIEVSSGLGFTVEGKKQTMQQIAEYMRGLASEGYVSKEAVQLIVEKLLEVYQFGNTQEFMDAMVEGTYDRPMQDDDLMKVKIAVAETMQDIGIAGKENEDRMIDTTKVGVAEALSDLQGGGQI